MNICETNIEKINDTFDVVSKASFQEKKEYLSKEQVIDNFLDKILELKERITYKSNKTKEIVERLEEITWYDNIDEEGLRMINEIISLSKDLHSTLIKSYVDLNFFIKKGIAVNEIKHFKSNIDNLKEVIQDFESVFFRLPKLPEFKEASKQLSLL